MAGLTHKLNEAWIAKDYFIELNGCEVRESDMLDLEIIYGGCSVNGILTIQDTQGIMSGSVDGSSSLQPGGFARIGWSAAGGCGGEFDETFSITKVKSTTDEKNRRLLAIEFVDSETRNAKGSFKAKNYNGKKVSEVAQEHYDLIKTSAPTQRTLKITPHKTEPKVSMAVPSNMDNFTFLNTWGLQQGYARIKDKFTDYFVSKQSTEFDMMATENEEFEVDPVSQFSFWRVLQYNLDGYDVNALMDSIPTQLSNTTGSLNEDGESKDKLAKSSNKVSAVKTEQAGKSKDQVASKGIKTGNKINESSQQYFNTLSNAQTCSIWVPGLNKNRIGFKSIVNFPKPSYLQANEHDPAFSGSWEITAVRDKIIRQYFVQELFLRRVG